jgi:hypothetical protein
MADGHAQAPDAGMARIIAGIAAGRRGACLSDANDPRPAVNVRDAQVQNAWAR